ncbi:MAG: hypothetical protein ACRDZY_17805 [Acidimicrobiales bacterium]
MTDPRVDETTGSLLEPQHPQCAQLLQAIQPAIIEGLRLITEEGVDVDDLRFEIRPAN